MNSPKLTNILLIILLIFNVVFLGKWWMGHPRFHHPKRESAPETITLLHDRNKGEMFLVNKLELDTLQQKKLDTLLTTHYHFLNKYMTVYIRNQSEIFDALKNTPDSAVAFRCADSLGILKVTMEKELYLHFLALKNICNSSQQTQYNELLDNISQEFAHRHKFSNSAKSNIHHDTL